MRRFAPSSPPALAGQIGAVAVPAGDLAALRDHLDAALEDGAAAIAEGRAPAPRPDFDAPLEGLRAALAPSGDAGVGFTTAFLLGRIVSDTTSLHFAAGMEPPR